MKNRYKIAVIPGDGIGQEVIQEALKVLEKLRPALQSELELQTLDLGAAQYLKTHNAMPEETWKELTCSDAILLGAVGDPRVPPGILEREILLKIRFDLDLYINLRPSSLLNGAWTPVKNKTAKDIDFTVIRENTESLYSGIGGVLKKGTADEVAIQEDINTRKGVERALRFAFELAEKRSPRKKLTLVDKANVLTHAHGLWRRAFAEVAQEFPGISTNALYVDAAAMDFIRRPETFDVIVTNNLFGDILTDLGAILSGGLGLAASANINPDPEEKRPFRAMGLFEPIHGSAPDIAGKGLANPIAAILAAGLLLEQLGEKQAAKKIDTAVKKTVADGKIFQPESNDLAISTKEVGDRVLSNLN